MSLRHGLSPALLLVLHSALAAQQTTTIPPGTTLWLSNQASVRMRVGQAVQATLKHPVYATEELLLPAGTVFTGHVISLSPDHAHRLSSRLRGDFTPFHQPVVLFTSMAVRGQAAVPVQLSPAADGSMLTELTPPPPAQGGIVRRQVHAGMEAARERMRTFTAPGKRERLMQYVYTQLPYHPQSIASGTVWTPETTAALTYTVPASVTIGASGSGASERGAGGSVAPPLKQTSLSTASASQIRIETALDQEISSTHSHVGDPIVATVVTPAYRPDGTLAVPAGAEIHGVITKAAEAKRFGRAGVVRFRFTEVKFARAEQTTHVQASIAGLDAPSGGNLKLDAEGNATPKAKDKVVVPLILLALAARPLDRDHGDGSLGKNAVASNALGMVGFIVGTAGGSPYVASSIGYYGSALSIYNRWIKRGEETRFQRKTRITLDTTVRQASMLPAVTASK